MTDLDDGSDLAGHGGPSGPFFVATGQAVLWLLLFAMYKPEWRFGRSRTQDAQLPGLVGVAFWTALAAYLL